MKMIEISQANQSKIKEYLATVLPTHLSEDNALAESVALALEAFDLLLQDMQQEDFKKQDYYAYSKGYLILNYLNWLVSKYTLEQLKDFVITKAYHNPAETGNRPSSCILGAAFNDPSSFPMILNSQKWEDVKDFVLSGNISKEDATSEFITLDDQNISNFLNVLPVLLLDELAVCSVQSVNDNFYYLRNMIQELLEDYLYL